MSRETLMRLIQWGGRAIILALCVLVGLLWARMDRQVAENKADIAELQAYSDSADKRLRDEVEAAQDRVENRWGQYLMPLLREHHRLLESLPDIKEPPPLPEWLEEKK